MRPPFLAPKTYESYPEVDEALATIDQGTVIRSVPCLYPASTAFPILAETKKALDDAGGPGDAPEIDVVLELDVLVVSHVCDIRGNPGSKYPLLGVVPVYEASILGAGYEKNPDAIKSADHLWRLTGEEFHESVWVADFRFRFAIEKGIIVGRKSLSGVLDAASAWDLARKLGEYHRRVGFAPEVDAILASLYGELKRLDIVTAIRDVRLFAHPTPARAERIGMLLVAAPLATEEIAAMNGALQPWLQSREGLAPPVSSFGVRSIADVTLLEVDGSVPVYARDLSEAPPDP